MLSKRDARNNTAAVAQAQFAYLGLHHAALSGNVGLVQYALSQGQPVDAVWDGISALHSAAAGGSEHVASLLITSGADVNFGRLPKNERELKTRTASSSSSTAMDKSTEGHYVRPARSERELRQRTASSSSTSYPEALLNPGSTPLHFACAHNHVLIARLLLANGAAPHLPDKRGVTPVDLLPPASPDSSASDALSIRAVIREYYELEKAKEKEFQKSHNRFHGKAAAVLGFPREDESMRVGVKRSLENLLTKSPKHIPAPLTTPSPGRRGAPPNGVGTPPPSPRHPSVTSERVPPSPTTPSRYIFGNATPTSSSYAGSTPAPTTGSTLSPSPGLDHRRPSLPHVFDDAPSSSPLPAMRPALPGARPRSAGSGAQPPPFGSQCGSGAPAFNSSGHARPRTKRSLLSLFKRADSADVSPDAQERDFRDRDRKHEPERGGSFSAAMGANWASPAARVRERTTSEFNEKAEARVAAGEVRTAPPERTTFSARVPEDVFVDDEEDYGVPLHGMLDHPLPPDFVGSPAESEDEVSSAEMDGEETVEDDGARDEELELERTGTASTGTTVRAGHEGRVVPPKHAEGWYRERMDASGSGVVSAQESGSDTTPPPTSPRPRPGILRGDHSVRRTASRGALRFEANGQEGQLREKGSRSSLLSVGSRSLLSVGSRSRSGSGSAEGKGNAEGNGKGDRLAAAAAVDNRGRGDSVSSASTDTSAPARSQISQETSTTATSVSSVPLDISDEEDAPALGLNIRTVSNHAQAEALVQKAAKEILELNSVADADAEPGPSLSEQLAAYGETLQLQRRFAKGEAQRFKSPTRMRFDGGGGGTDEEGEERRWEDGRRRQAQERMEWSQKVMGHYAKGEGGKDKRTPEVPYKDNDGQRDGCALERTTSLEKEMGTGPVGRTPRCRTPKLRRPHTSDSVRSTGSGNAPPPRFGHSTTQSSTNLRPNVPGNTLRVFNPERRAHHHASRSVSAHPRAESLDHNRPSAPLPDDPVPALHHSPEREDVPLDPASARGLALAAANRSAFLASTTALDDFGAHRPHKQRFGGLRSLFGKGK